ncbi:hypothetical protein, partial [Saccharospirillum impatiens]|uniref:hypothetical protein n=1 Tax=Saccharospirillum impatiens TaxID=169438 RepID=UPI001B7F9B4A
DLSPLELVAYNYTVEDYETYFVGEFGLWVHNSCRVLTNRRARDIAEDKGFKNVSGNVPSRVQRAVGENPVYYDKDSNRYYSPDKAGHRADDAWKRFDRDGNRETGVFDEDGSFLVVSD